MNDAEFIYKQDVKEKAVTARSARNYKGSRSGRCKLSTDNMTRKEWESMNGPIVSMNPSEPISWERFRALPRNMQREYIKYILDRYTVGPYALARMFGIGGARCSAYIHELGFSFDRKASRKETERFLADYSIDKKPARNFRECLDYVSTLQDQTPCADKKNTQLDHISVTFSGAFSPEEIAAKLKGFFAVDQQVIITVDITAVR